MEKIETLALLFSDKSMSVFAPGRELDDVREERDTGDRHETRREHLTKIARVQVEVVEMIDDPERRPLENNIAGVKATLQAIVADPALPAHLRTMATRALSLGQGEDRK